MTPRVPDLVRRLWLVDRLGLADLSPQGASMVVSAGAIVAICLVSIPLQFLVGRPKYVLLSLSGVAGFLAVVLAVRQLRSVALGGSIYALSAFITLTSALLMDGGLASSATPWIALVPAIFYTLGDFRWGAVGFAGSVALALGMLTFDSAIQAAWPPSGNAGHYAMHIALASICMVSLMVALNVERDKALGDVLKSEAGRVAAEVASASKSRVLASVSHEIRTPLNGILGSVELMRVEHPEGTLDERLAVVQDSGELLLSILDDVLDMARIESGQLRLVSAPMSPRRAVANVVMLLQPQAKQAGLVLSEVTHVSDELFILLDGQRVRQVLLNLVGNAIKFTESGEVVIRHELEDGHWVVRVEDSGLGISPERLSAIFEPFVQAEQHTARRFGGSGLGLAISRHLANEMGGSLTVTSVLGEGSVFILREPAIHCAPVEDSPAPALHASAFPNLHVLVVDDNPINLTVLTSMLKMLGHTTDVARDGLEALESCKENAFDAVLMDVEMPRMDGLEAARRLRSENTIENIPIFAVSASAFPGDRQRALESGMDGFLSKPVRIAQLQKLLGGEPVG